MEDFPFGIAYDSVNERMYVTTQSSGNVSVIDTTTNTVIDTIAVGDLFGLMVLLMISFNKRMYVDPTF